MHTVLLIRNIVPGAASPSCPPNMLHLTRSGGSCHIGEQDGSPTRLDDSSPKLLNFEISTPRQNDQFWSQPVPKIVDWYAVSNANFISYNVFGLSDSTGIGDWWTQHQLTVFESAIYSLSAAINYLLMYGGTKTNGLGREHWDKDQLLHHSVIWLCWTLALIWEFYSDNVFFVVCWFF